MALQAAAAATVLFYQLGSLALAWAAWRRGQRRLAGLLTVAHYAGTFGLVVAIGPLVLDVTDGDWTAAGLIYAAGMMTMVIGYGMWLIVTQRKGTDG